MHATSQEALEMGRIGIDRLNDNPEAARYHLAYADWAPWTQEDWIAELDPQSLKRTNIYVDFPFCPQVCSFCAFYPELDRKGDRVDLYADQLQTEIRLLGELLDGKQMAVSALEFGGGTPTQMSAQQLRDVCATLAATFPVTDDVERNFESTPEKLLGPDGEEKVAALREAGFDRASMGAQSFDQSVLDLANRHHSPDETRAAMKVLRDAGFERINIDIMIGLRGQSLDSALATIEETIAIDPDIIELYTMRYFDTKRPVPMTRHFLHHPEDFLTEEEAMRARLYAHVRLTGLGYVSSNGRTYFRDRGEGDYYAMFYKGNFLGDNVLGIGRKSHSNMYPFQYANFRNLEKYGAALEAGRLPIATGIRMTDEMRLAKLISGGLQLRTPFDFAAACARFPSVDPAPFAAQFDKLAAAGLVTLSEGRVTRTERGFFFIEEMLKSLYDVAQSQFNQDVTFLGAAQRKMRPPKESPAVS
ncbi:coproporphyrinogen-III oxidase family protein [Marinibacterium profundimaris]|nr:coproporphyrinogen-III oxidase family protein [Marinibacterium profundimaris]